MKQKEKERRRVEGGHEQGHDRRQGHEGRRPSEANLSFLASQNKLN